MIVNPQFFSYKIIIGALIVTVAFVGGFSYNAYESNKTKQHFLEQEKKLVETELSQMILRYDEISLSNHMLSERLDSATHKAKTTLEKLSLMKSDFSVFSNFKSELSAIKSENNSLFKTTDSINQLKEDLESEKEKATKALVKQKKINNSLLKINKSLNSSVEKAALLTANSFQATAHKSSQNATETIKASLTNRIDVCFTLAENLLAEKGKKDIYVQILNPLNNVVGKKGAVEFGKFLLTYSDKQVINYNNEVLDICTTINAEKNDKPFSKGTYYVSVFHNEKKLGSTQIILN